MEDKELDEALNGFDVLVKRGCTCMLHVISRPFRSEIIYNKDCPIHNGCICKTHPVVTLVSRTAAVGCPSVQLTIRNDSCPIHTEQWRRDYLGLA